MNKKRKAIELLSDYFAEHGMLTMKQYKHTKDVPVRIVTIKRVFGTYAKMQRAFAQWEPDLYDLAIGEQEAEALAKYKEVRDALVSAEAKAAELAREEAAEALAAREAADAEVRDES